MMMMKTHVITVPPILKLTEMLVTFSEAVAILFPSELNDMAAMRLSWAGIVTTALCGIN